MPEKSDKKQNETAEFRGDTTERDKDRSDLPWSGDSESAKGDSSDDSTKDSPGHRQADSGPEPRGGTVKK